MKDQDKKGNANSVKITPRELEREARRLLPLIAKPRCLASQAAGGRDQDVLITMRPGQKKPTAVCEIRIMTAFCQQQWVKTKPKQERSGMQWSITNEGLAWLAHESGNEEAYRAQHRVLSERKVTMPDGTVRPVRVNDRESPLGWLRSRKGPDGEPFLNQSMFDAGERLRADFTKARLEPGITTDWDRIQTRASGRRANGVSDLSDSALAARQRFDSATGVLGPEVAQMVVDVCCFMIQLGDAERARKWPQRSAKLVLRIGLDILCRHYGMSETPAAPELRRKAHVWRRPDGQTEGRNNGKMTGEVGDDC